MFISSLVLFAVGISALSHSTTDQVLEQRDASATLASFDDNDTSCSSPTTIDHGDSGAVVSSWTLSGGACVNAKALDDRVGGDWGDMANIQMFMDDSCVDPLPGYIIHRSGAMLTYCVPLSDFGCGPTGSGGDACLWRSLMAQSVTRVPKAPNDQDGPSKEPN